MSTRAIPIGNRKRVLDQLRKRKPAVMPSMLQCNFCNLEAEMHSLHSASVAGIHLDVMDGHFVPNFTYGMPIVESFRKLSSVPIDAHLMISDPAKYAMQFIDAGADLITFHVEAVDEPIGLLHSIKNRDVAAGLAINPSTDFGKIEPFISDCDLVLVMSVEAGFGGQAFNPAMLDRVQKVREIGGPDLLVEMDGGIGEKTIQACCTAGADLLVVGSAIFGKADYGSAIARLNDLIAAAS